MALIEKRDRNEMVVLLLLRVNPILVLTLISIKMIGVWTEMSRQTVLTQIRLVLNRQSGQFLHCLQLTDVGGNTLTGFDYAMRWNVKPQRVTYTTLTLKGPITAAADDNLE